MNLTLLLKKDKEDTNKVIHLNNLSEQYENRGSYDTAMNYANAALQLAQQLDFQKGISNSFLYMGNVYDDKGNYLLALENYLKALDIQEKLGYKKGISSTTNNIGIVYHEQADYPKALDFFLKALKLDEELKDKGEILTDLGNVGLVYDDQSDYTKALDYYLKAYNQAEKLGDKLGVAINLGNIGITYKKQAMTNSELSQKNWLLNNSLDCLFKSLKMREELGIKNLIASTLGNIGMVYSKQAEINTTSQQREKLYDKALVYYFKALKINEEIGRKKGIATYMGNIGSLYTVQKKYKEAYDYTYRSLALSDSIGTKGGIKEDYEILSTLYETANIPLNDSLGGKLLNMEQMRLRALYYHKRFIAVRDTLFSEESKKQLVRKEMNYEFEKKDAVEKAEQGKKEAIAASEKARFAIFFWLVCAIALAVAVLAFVISRSLRITRKQKAEIEEQKHLVEEKQKEILDSIYYARRIQQSLLPTEKYIERNLRKLQKNN